MHTVYPGNFAKQQQGAATLFIAVFLLVAVSLVMIYTAGPSITETRLAANEIRGKQAAAAAQAGVDRAIRNVNAGGNFSAAFTQSSAGWGTVNSSFWSGFFDSATLPANLPACPTAAGSLTQTATASATKGWLVSCGWSDDNAARKRIVTFVGKPPAVPGTVGNPLIAGSTVTLTGNSTVVNYFNNLTIWSGDNMSVIGNNGKTVVRRPSTAAGALSADQVTSQVGNGNSVCNVGQAPNLICTTSSSVNGPDVIGSDTTLANLSADEYFQNFMGYSPLEYKSGVASDIVASADAGSISAGGKNYWVTGNASIGQDVGTNGNPVVLVVDGDLALSGNSTIYGLVFVRGNLTSNGGPLIRGAVIVKGTASLVGNFNVIYDPTNLPGGNGPSSYASLPGTWRDF